jgi:hypothetical protein
VSAASDYGVALVDALIIPAFDDDGRNVFASNDPVTAVGDVIAYLLHWVEAHPEHWSGWGEEMDAEEAVDLAIDQGRRHWAAERGDGDDIAQDSADRYLELIGRLLP